MGIKVSIVFVSEKKCMFGSTLYCHVWKYSSADITLKLSI